MKHSGNTILVTGGTSGIGLGLALRLQEAGNTVVVAGRRRELLARIAEQHPGIGTVELDVTDPDSVARARRQMQADHPDLNVVLAAAGVMLPEDVLDPGALPVAEDTVATNLLGTIRTVYAFAPQLSGRPDAAILTVSSGLAFVPMPLTPTYIWTSPSATGDRPARQGTDHFPHAGWAADQDIAAAYAELDPLIAGYDAAEGFLTRMGLGRLLQVRR